MSGWRPKTSKLGRLPNCTFEPRKSLPLRTTFKNAAEFESSLIAWSNVVQNPCQK